MKKKTTTPGMTPEIYICFRETLWHHTGERSYFCRV